MSPSRASGNDSHASGNVLTLEEKAALVVGSGYWATVAVPGIPSVSMNDGPHGLRTQPNGGDNLGLGSSLPATCFPPATGLASSWNRELIERVARAIGVEAIEQGVDIVLGPGVNIKRSPLCGRNFEYFSEDPFVSGELGAAWVRGVQSVGVGASLKHFAANNQETARMTVSAEVDERTLREIYLPAFESIVTRERPWTVMCAYNRVNGVPAAENRWLLTEVLRHEWGFDGIVVSDWGAVDQRVPALAAGLDLEMPGPQRDSTEAVIAAVLSGELDEAVLDGAVERIARLASRASASGVASASGSSPEALEGSDHAMLPSRTSGSEAVAREAAAESMVLLRNEGGLLPLDTNQSIAVIGEFARTPRFQGSGSSQVNPTRVDAALPSIEALAPVEFAAGYTLNRRADPEPLISEAVRVASRASIALLFVGLPPDEESEGFDRDHIELPAAHIRLIREVAAVNPRTVVILSNGGVVSLEPWHDDVPVILESWLLGQAGGAAVADVLFGRVAPSGRLAESIPLRLQDTPSYLNFPGENDEVRYGEGVFVGYRYFESADVPVRYPFGFGLGYTTFEVSDLRVAAGRDTVRARVTVTNTGDRAGKHVVQLYVVPAPSAVARPRRELRGFEKVALEPGESTEVAFELDARAFAHWDTRTHDWLVPGGDYVIEVGDSAHDIVLSAPVHRRGPAPGRLTLESSVGELLEHPVTGPILHRAVRGANDQSDMHGSLFDMVATVPIRRLMRFPGVGDSMRHLPLLLRLANNPVVRTVAGWFQRR